MSPAAILSDQCDVNLTPAETRTHITPLTPIFVPHNAILTILFLAKCISNFNHDMNHDHDRSHACASINLIL